MTKIPTPPRLEPDLRAMQIPGSAGTKTRRVAFLTNILLPHRVALLEAFAPYTSELRMFLSAENEPDRKQPIDWKTLNVTLQHSFRWTRHFVNALGYQDVSHIQIPYDTYYQLWRYRPEIVLTHEFGVRTVFACLYRLLNRRTRLILWATLSRRTEMTRGKVRIALRRVILRMADACFVHGADGEAYLREFGYAKPVFFIPYVTDNAAYQGERLPPRDGLLRIVTIGQLIERKGLLPFTVALAEWCAEHPSEAVEFVLAGEGPEQERLEALSVPPNLTLKFLGHLGTEQVSQLYRSSSLYAFPTLGDEWGMVVNEALSAGLPVLGSIHAQACLELIQEGENGWLFDPASAADITRCLHDVLDGERSRWKWMSQRAQESMEMWTPQVIAARMASSIEAVIRGDQS